MVGWLEIPKNHSAAVDAVAFAPDPKKDDAFLDFIASAREFQGWDRHQIQAALDQANDQNLMEINVSKKPPVPLDTNALIAWIKTNDYKTHVKMANAFNRGRKSSRNMSLAKFLSSGWFSELRNWTTRTLFLALEDYGEKEVVFLLGNLTQDYLKETGMGHGISAGDSSALWDWMNGDDSMMVSKAMSRAYQKGGLQGLAALLVSRVPEFRDWDEEAMMNSLGDLEAQDMLSSVLGETTSGPSPIVSMVAEAVRKGIFSAIKEQAKPKVVKISKTRIAEGVRKAVRKVLAENALAGRAGSGQMPGGAMPPAGHGAVNGVAATTMEEGGVDSGLEDKVSEALAMVTHDDPNAVFGLNREWRDIKRHYPEMNAEAAEDLASAFLSAATSPDGVSPNDGETPRMTPDEFGSDMVALGMAVHAAMSKGLEASYKTRFEAVSRTFSMKPQDLQESLTQLGGLDMELSKMDGAVFNRALREAKLNPHKAHGLMQTGEGLHKVISALMKRPDKRAHVIAEHIMDLLGWEMT